MSTNFVALIPSRMERPVIDGTNYLDIRYACVPFGRSAAGWAFCLTIYPAAGIPSLDAWMQYLSLHEEVRFMDDYGRFFTREEMEQIIKFPLPLGGDSVPSEGSLAEDHAWFCKDRLVRRFNAPCTATGAVPSRFDYDMVWAEPVGPLQARP